MMKCNVCGKNSLLPEKFGNVNVCKVCFVKANGPYWKRVADKYEDVKKLQESALSYAEKQNFPESVLSAINDYFENQLNSMKTCDCCKMPVQTLQTIEKAKICKQCFAKINTSAWKEDKYDNNDDVEKNRQKVLKIAFKNGFPTIVIDSINKHFDSKIQKGLIKVVDSHRGQILKIFEDHAVLITKDSFDIEETSKEYGKAIKNSQPKENLISNTTAKKMARNVLSGGIVKAGINMATSVAIDLAADAIAPPKGIFKVVKGSYNINYLEYSQVEFQKVGDNDIGFIKFRNPRYSNDPSEDIIFFFGSSDGKEKIFNEILRCVETTNKAKNTNQSGSFTAQVQPIIQTSAADEILKYKNLLDIGAITQEEFDKKKKELLNM